MTFVLCGCGSLTAGGCIVSLPLPVQNRAVFDEVAQWLCRIPHAATIGLQFLQGERGRATLNQAGFRGGLNS